MNVVLLTNYTRLMALGLEYCGVYVGGSGKIEWTCLPEFRFKFVVLTDHTLVIGPIGDHKELYVVHETWGQPIEEVCGHISVRREACSDTWPKPIIAAGEISADGIITGWKSEGFNVSTPDAMKPEIEREVVLLFQSGRLEMAT